MKTIQDEARNLTIEEITKLEADTIGLSFFSKDSESLGLPFRDDESVTKYQNLLSGNDRTVNRELFVHFERRQRDFMEYVVKKIIPSGQSLFFAKQIDSGIKEFIDKNDSRNYQIVEFGSNKQYIPDNKAESTDWINYFANVDYAELPESLSEDNFIKGVYEIFSYQVLPLRLQCHNQDEGTQELAEIAKRVQHLIRYRMIDFTYLLQLNELIQNPIDLKLLKKDFKHEVFDSFDDFKEAVHYLFDFYSHLCECIGEYEKTRVEKSKKEKWFEIFRKCAYKERPSYDSGERKNEQFWDSLEDLRLSEFFQTLKKEFANVNDDNFFNEYLRNGAKGLIQEAHRYGSKDFNSFIVPFINGIIEIVNSLSGCTQNLKRISTIDEIDTVLEAIGYQKDFYDEDDAIFDAWKKSIDSLVSENTEEKPHLWIEKEELSESEKTVYKAVRSISAELLSNSKNYSEKLNTKQWFAFLRSLVEDKTFTMKEEQKTKNFVRFQNEMLGKSASAFNDFVSQLSGVFEYQGFLTSINMCLENLEDAKKLSDDEKEDRGHYNYSYYKTSFDFIENALLKIKEKAKDFKKEENDYSPSWKHRTWCNFLDTLRDESYSVEKIPNQIDNWYWDKETEDQKQKYDGITTFRPLNIYDFKTILEACVRGVPDTVSTIIYDLFHVNDNYTYRTSNMILDKYKYSGLMEQNPFAHSTVSIFYKFLYEFFMYLRSNISEFLPRGLSQKKTLEYSLMFYVAKYILNTNYDNYSEDKKLRTEEVRKFTFAKHFVKRYFEKKGGVYKPSMRCANSALKKAVKEAGCSIGNSLSELASMIDTKRKSEDLKNMPSASAYVFSRIISEDSLFPKAISSSVVKKYRTDYFNYYLLCNFIKALTPYFEDRAEKIISEIADGILGYTFYSDKDYKTNSIKNGFDYLLRQKLKGNSYSDVPFYEEYFWYSEQKDDRILRKLRRVNYRLVTDCYYRMNDFASGYYRQEEKHKYVDVELEAKYAEYFRDELDEGIGDFYYNYFLAKLEYYKFKQDSKTNSLKNVIDYYDKAFKYIYCAGTFADYFVTDVAKIYEPIRESQRIYNNYKDSLKRLENEYRKYPKLITNCEERKKYIEDEYSRNIKWARDRFGFEISSSNIREISTTPLKHIWQWAEAAGLVNRSYEHIDGRRVIGGSMWGNDYYYNRNDNTPRVRENFEKLIEDLEKED